MTLHGGLGVTGNYDSRRRLIMNPVVGLDISKGESQVQAFLDKGKPYRKSFKVTGGDFYHPRLGGFAT